MTVVDQLKELPAFSTKPNILDHLSFGNSHLLAYPEKQDYLDECARIMGSVPVQLHNANNVSLDWVLDRATRTGASITLNTSHFHDLPKDDWRFRLDITRPEFRKAFDEMLRDLDRVAKRFARPFTDHKIPWILIDAERLSFVNSSDWATKKAGGEAAARRNDSDLLWLLNRWHDELHARWPDAKISWYSRFRMDRFESTFINRQGAQYAPSSHTSADHPGHGWGATVYEPTADPVAVEDRLRRTLKNAAEWGQPRGVIWFAHGWTYDRTAYPVKDGHFEYDVEFSRGWGDRFNNPPKQSRSDGVFAYHEHVDAIAMWPPVGDVRNYEHKQEHFLAYCQGALGL